MFLEWNTISHVIWYLFGSEEARKIKWLQTVSQRFDQLEKSSAVPLSNEELHSLNSFLDGLKDSKSTRIMNEVYHLQRGLIGYLYRLEKANGGLDKEHAVDENLYLSLQTLALQWKTSQNTREKSLTAKDLLKLKRSCKRPYFAQLLLVDEYYRKRFFIWALSHGNSVKPFIEFPAHVQKLIHSDLSTRIGFNGGKDLKVVPLGQSQKDLTLQIEGKPESLLDDERKVILSQGYTLKIKEIMKIFQDRAFRVGNLEYFPGLGICNWNPQELGPYRPATQDYKRIPLEGKDWIKALTPMRTLSLEEAKLYFEDRQGHLLSCDGNQWVFTIIGTNEKDFPGLEGAHAYLVVAIPTSDGKNYHLYPFGKFARHYPQTIMEKLKTLVDYKLAVIEYPDENHYLDRDREGVSALASSEEALHIMEAIKQDLLKARNAKLYFQIFVHNCIFWAFKIVRPLFSKKEAVEICGLPFLEPDPGPVLSKIKALAIRLPAAYRTLPLTFVATLLRPNKQSVQKKNGATKVLSFAQRYPWRGGGFEPHLHPGALILRKRTQRNLT